MNLSRGRALRIGLLLALLLALALGGPVRADNTPSLSAVYLVGPGGVGGVVTWSTSITYTYGIGNDLSYAMAQSFHPIPGVFSEFQVQFWQTVGSPTGDVTWELHDSHEGYPGAILQSGTLTPTAYARSTVTVSQDTFVTDVTYWLVLRSTLPQATGDYWTVAYASGEYPPGHWAYTTNPGISNYYTIFSDASIVGSFTTVAGAAPAAVLNDYIAQSFTVTSQTVVSGFKLDLRKYADPVGTLTLSLESDFGDQRSGVLVDPVASATVAESSLSTDPGLVDFAYSQNIALPVGKFWLVLTTDRTDSTNYVAWIAASFCAADGSSLKVHNLGVWSPLLQSAMYQPDLVSIAAVATAAPVVDSYVALPGGGAGIARAEFTAGDGAISVLLIGVFALLVFGVFHMVRKR